MIAEPDVVKCGLHDFLFFASLRSRKRCLIDENSFVTTKAFWSANPSREKARINQLLECKRVTRSFHFRTVDQVVLGKYTYLTRIDKWMSSISMRESLERCSPLPLQPNLTPRNKRKICLHYSYSLSISPFSQWKSYSALYPLWSSWFYGLAFIRNSFWGFLCLHPSSPTIHHFVQMENFGNHKKSIS